MAGRVDFRLGLPSGFTHMGKRNDDVGNFLYHLNHYLSELSKHGDLSPKGVFFNPDIDRLILADFGFPIGDSDAEADDDKEGPIRRTLRVVGGFDDAEQARLLAYFRQMGRASEALLNPGLPNSVKSVNDEQSSIISYLEAVAENVEAQFLEAAKEAAAESHRNRMALAAKLAPALNAKIQANPPESIEGKKALAAWINDQLEPLGLAVQCPKTGQPAKLRGTSGNKWPDVGRYFFEIQRDGKPYKSTYSDTLPELTLTDSNRAARTEAVWQETVGPKSSRRGRAIE